MRNEQLINHFKTLKRASFIILTPNIAMKTGIMHEANPNHLFIMVSATFAPKLPVPFSKSTVVGSKASNALWSVPPEKKNEMYEPIRKIDTTTKTAPSMNINVSLCIE